MQVICSSSADPTRLLGELTELLVNICWIIFEHFVAIQFVYKSPAFTDSKVLSCSEISGSQGVCFSIRPK
jgi:hypothetical protein